MFRLTLVCFAILATLSAQECKERQLLANVVRRQIGNVKALPELSLKATVNGSEVPIGSINNVDLSPRVIVLVDRSGSMKSKKEFMQSFVAALLTSFPKNSEGTVLLFNDSVEGLGGFTTEHDRLACELSRKLQGKETFQGRTRIFNALDEAKRKLGSIAYGDALVLVTDGGDPGSAPADVSTWAEAGVRMYVAGFWDRDRMTSEEERTLEVLQNLAYSSGGAVVRHEHYNSLSGFPQSEDAMIVGKMIATRIFNPLQVVLRAGERFDNHAPVQLSVNPSFGLNSRITVEHQRYATCVPPSSSAAIQP